MASDTQNEFLLLTALLSLAAVGVAVTGAVVLETGAVVFDGAPVAAVGASVVGALVGATVLAKYS